MKFVAFFLVVYLGLIALVAYNLMHPDFVAEFIREFHAEINRQRRDAVLGKAPQHVDVSALRHTEIVYRSAEEIRKALIDAGRRQHCSI